MLVLQVVDLGAAKEIYRDVVMSEIRTEVESEWEAKTVALQGLALPGRYTSQGPDGLTGVAHIEECQRLTATRERTRRKAQYRGWHLKEKPPERMEDGEGEPRGVRQKGVAERADAEQSPGEDRKRAAQWLHMR